MDITKEAQELNAALQRKSGQVYGLLSEAGRKAYFPKAGILSQTAEAKGKKLNATIGIALDDDGKPLSLESLTSKSSLILEETLLYSPSYGQQRLREMWHSRIRKSNPSIKGVISLPVVTSAVTHGLSIIGRLFINDGDRIILPDMFWENYGLVFHHAGLERFPMFMNNEFNVQGLHEKLDENKGKQVILLNFPNNPTGYSATQKDANGIAKAIMASADMGNKILVICDDSYFGLFYDENAFTESMFSKIAGLHPNVLAVKLDGITKEMYAWGLRIGFITYGFKGMDRETAALLEDKTAGAVRGTISNACTHSQFLAIRALEDKDIKKQEDANYYVLKERYQETKKLLERKGYRKFFEPLPFNSGYFMCIRLKAGNAEEIRQKLLKKYDTGLISVGDKLRIAFSSVPKPMLEELFGNIYEACKE